jgi:photosystem II stability/assembly factor-like uncharacterized protein
MLIFSTLFCFCAKSQTSWIKQTSGTKNALTSVYFSNENFGYAIGDKGTILKTSDGGLNWILDTSNIIGNLTSVYAIKNTCYIVGQTSILTKDHFGVGLIYKTDELNKKWSLTKTEFGVYADYLKSVYFVTKDTGFIVGLAGLILKTSNGGKDWLVQNIVKPGDSYYNLESVYFIDSNNGFAVGGFADTIDVILKTVNGGSTWIKQQSSSKQYLNSVYFSDLNTGYIVGGSMREKNGIILKTTDRGLTWKRQLYEKPDEFYYEFKSVFFTDSITGYTVGSSVAMSPYKKIVKIDKVDGLILKTVDGGNKWVKQESGVSNVLLSIFFSNKNVGYIVGDKGIILKFHNGDN